MLISEKHKFLFVHIPKTGGTSIKLALEPYAEPNQFQYLPEKDLLRSKLNNQHKVRLHKKLTKDIAERHKEKFKFCVLRHPLDWHSSFWQFNAIKQIKGEIKDMNWGEYITYAKTNKSTQLRFIMDGDTILVDKIIKFNELEKGFKEVCQHLHISPTLHHHNSIEKKDYTTLYSKAQIEAIKEISKKETELLGWEF